MSEEFRPGRAMVPPPTPWDTLTTWGKTGEIPPPPEGRPWIAPGPPPGTRRRGMPGWAIALVTVGAVLVLGCGGLTVLGAVSTLASSGAPPATSPAPAGPSAIEAVETSGECQRTIVGEYGVVATVKARNTTEEPVTGRLWVRWPITGAEPLEMTKELTVAPGSTEEFHVDEKVEAARWLRLGDCVFGWTTQ